MIDNCDNVGDNDKRGYAHVPTTCVFTSTRNMQNVSNSTFALCKVVHLADLTSHVDRPLGAYRLEMISACSKESLVQLA